MERVQSVSLHWNFHESSYQNWPNSPAHNTLHLSSPILERHYA